MSESASPDSAPLSVEQAIASLTPEPIEEAAPEAPVEAAEEPQENTEGEASSPEEAAEGAETPDDPAEEGEAVEEAETLPDPPLYWSPEGKAKWANLSPEARAEILAQEGPRETAVAKAKAEAADLSQKAQAEIAKVAQLSEVLGERVGQWVETFQSRWGTQTPDWSAYATENGVEAMVLLKTQFEAEQHQLAEAVQAKTIAETQAHEARFKAEFAKLAEIAPDLADPVAGPAKRKEISQKLVGLGIPQGSVQNISAVEMALARDAFLWREAQTKLSTAPKPKPALAAKPAPVRPSAAQSQTPTQRNASQAANRFAQTRSVDDAVALLLNRK